MDRRKLLDKLYFKLVGLDFDNVSFTNHIALDEVIADLRALREEVEVNLNAEDDGPPPLPVECLIIHDKVLAFPPPVPRLTLKVMILDEDIEMQSLVNYSLQSENGVEVTLERSPEQALRRIAKLKPDLVMLDVMMKEMTCLEFMNRLRHIDHAHDVEIIIGSNNPNQHEKNAAFEMGAVDYITRPYDLSEVRFKVKLRYENKRKLCG